MSSSFTQLPCWNHTQSILSFSGKSLYKEARWLSCLHRLHCCLTARRSWVRFPLGALLALGGRSSPECTVGYLQGLSVWSLHVLPVFTKGFLHLESQQKNMQKEQNTPVRPSPRLTVQLVPGR